MRFSAMIGWVKALGDRFPQHFLAMFLFSIAINLLLLVSPLYMLQVYDRVLSSGSFDALIWLTLIAAFLLGIYAAVEAGRRRIAALAAHAIEAHYAGQLFARFEDSADNAPPLLNDIQNVNRVAGVFQNGAVLVFFDLPFAPLFLGVLFLLSPWLGVLGLLGAVGIIALALRAESRSRALAEEGAAETAQAQEFVRGIARQRSALVAMGIVGEARSRWEALRVAAANRVLAAASSEGGYAGISRSARQVLQILILGAGAALTLVQELSPGGIVAASILSARAFAPIDQITGGWRQMVQVRNAWGALNERYGNDAEDRSFTPLPKPKPVLEIDRLTVLVSGVREPVIRAFSSAFQAGAKVAVVGGNGAGKTTLLQTLAAVNPAGTGTVSLGGRSLHAWPGADRGPHIGYLPQAIELLPGTIAANIARLKDGDPDAVIAAARAGCAHAMILSLPAGYETLINGDCIGLSSGQRQLIGLARALYGSPVLLLLDEPTASLDPASAEAVIDALAVTADGGAIVIAATHDPRLIAASDTVLSIEEGAVRSMPSLHYLDLANRSAARAGIQKVAG